MSDDRAGTISTEAPDAGGPGIKAGHDIGRDHRLRLFHEMLRIRRFEEKCAELYSAGKIRGFLHLYIGEEAVAVGAPRQRWIDACLRCAGSLLRRQRHRRRRPSNRGRARPRRPDATAPPSDGVLLR